MSSAAVVISALRVNTGDDKTAMYTVQTFKLVIKLFYVYFSISGVYKRQKLQKTT